MRGLLFSVEAGGDERAVGDNAMQRAARGDPYLADGHERKEVVDLVEARLSFLSY